MRWTGVRKPFLLHVGTHKTATTSLQASFASRERVLLSRGSLYPRTGRVGHGQHNVAWGLLRDERFDPRAGYLNELVEEIRHHEPERVIVSSEDFEYLHRLPDQMTCLRSRIRMIGFDPIIVIVLRDPADYVESLYAELARHGLADQFTRFVDEALTHRRVTFNSWDFQLDYNELAHQFARVFGRLRVMAMAYDETDMIRRFLRNFPSVAGDPGDSFIALRLNRRSSSAETLRAVAVNRVLRTGPQTGVAPPLSASAEIDDLKDESSLGREQRAIFLERYRHQMERALRRYPVRSLETLGSIGGTPVVGSLTQVN